MIESTKKTYSIWGEFSHTDFTSLNKLQQSVNYWFNGPLFKVHLTLSGPFHILDEKILGGLEDLAMTNSVFEMRTKGYGTEDNIFQSFYIQIQISPELLYLKKRLDDLLKIPPKEYNPHISLFYGNKQPSAKDDVISKLDSPPKMITLDRLSIVEIVDDIASWKVLYSYPLAKELNAKLTLGRPV
tara:strand:+ start:2319 stop:2873 length:555 start_codon:yes stop_codon:yes gene_type:complete